MSNLQVLFVSSGNSRLYKVAPFIRSQAASLAPCGVQVTHFSVEGKGVLNYLRNAYRLRRFVSERDFDVMHAHYSLCGWVAVLAKPRMPIVLSLMGTDALGDHAGANRVRLKSRLLVFLTVAVQHFVDAVISKSKNISRIVWQSSAYIIPNGVDLTRFAKSKVDRAQLGLEPHKKYVLFLGNPADTNKNVKLVADALSHLDRDDLELKIVYKAPHGQVAQYLNTADVFALCSFSEGSPNVVKEAMACGVPMVVTPAGDASDVVDGVAGCYVSSYHYADFAQKLELALQFRQEQGRTKGRERLIDLGLDNETIAGRLTDLYRSLLAARQD